VVKSPRDYVERRLVIEYGRRYIYAYMTSGDGKIVGDNEESWQQPYVLDISEVREEAKDLYDWIWQHMTDAVNGTLQEGDEDAPESD
jgi:hypothetical protein